MNLEVGEKSVEVSKIFVRTISDEKKFNKCFHQIPMWSIPELIQAQKNDELFGQIVKYLKNGENKHEFGLPFKHKINGKEFFLSGYHLRDDILHYEEENDKSTRKGQRIVKVAIPAVLTNKLIAQYHNSPMSGHGGIQKTIDRIKEKYVVEKLKEKVENFRANCETCHKHRIQNSARTPLYKYPIIPKAFHQIHMDLIGPLPISFDGNKYIIVFVDRFTRYTVISPIKDKTAVSVAHALFNKIICEYTTPSVILSDNGREFVNEIMMNLCDIYNIKKGTITSYCPFANGIVENANKRIIAVVKTAVSRSYKDWDTLLPFVQCALNTAYHPSVGDNPHYLLFLNDKILPHEKILERCNMPKYGGQDEYIEKMLVNQKIAYQAVEENLTLETEKFTSKFNEGTKSKAIRVGNRVYVRKRPSKGYVKKFDDIFQGPFRVMKDVGRGRFLLKHLKSGKDSIVHEMDIKTVVET